MTSCFFLKNFESRNLRLSGQPYFLQLDVVENHSDGGIAGVQGASGTPSASPLIGYVNTAGEVPSFTFLAAH